MDFHICGLDNRQFSHLYGKDTEYLARHGVRRLTVDSKPGYPCRVSLRDVEIGEPVLLMNYEHHPGPSPYRSAHAIFVKEWAQTANLARNEVPEVIRTRLLSVRAFDALGMMVDADVVDGPGLEPLIDRLFSDDSVSYLHIHNAKPGCFAARVTRTR